MNNPDVIVAEDAGWSRFPNGLPELIVDPMVFRTADVYLRGRRGAEQSLPGKEPDEMKFSVSQHRRRSS